MKVGRLLASVLTLILLAASLGLSRGSLAGQTTQGTRGSDTEGTWEEFRGNLNNTGYSMARVPLTNNVILRFDTGWMSRSSPVVGGDILYFGSNSGKVYAVNITTGVEAWNYTTGSEVWATPLVVGNQVIEGSMDGILYTFNRFNGSRLWTFQANDSIVSSAKYTAGMVVFSSYDGNVYFLDAATGLQAAPPFKTYGQIWDTSAIVDGTAIVGSNDGKVYRIWLGNSTEMWNFTLAPDLSDVKYSSPAVEGNRIFIGSNDHSAYSLDLATGSLVWKFTTGDSVYSSPAVHGGKVFVHSTDGYLYALPFDDPNHDGSISTSEILWRFRTFDGFAGEGGSSPAIADGKVLVTSRPGHIYCLDMNGAEVWNYTVAVADHTAFSSPALIDGMVFAGLSDGAMYGFGKSIPGMRVEIIPSEPSGVLESERAMEIVFNVTRGGRPVEGAFVTLTVSSGILSQSGASTLEDGKQKVKYLAPKVTQNTTVTISAKATKSGMEDAFASIRFTVIPGSGYSTESGTGFSIDKYQGWIIAIGVLAAANIIVYVLLATKRRRRPTG